MTYNAVNPGLILGQTQKSDRVKPVNVSNYYWCWA